MAATERVTVTLAGDLVEEIDRLERNRSRFIAEAVRQEIARRRREALLRSVRDPHPETQQAEVASVADWVSDLPHEPDLVDMSSGVPVRWIEGRGWVDDPT